MLRLEFMHLHEHSPIEHGSARHNLRLCDREVPAEGREDPAMSARTATDLDALMAELQPRPSDRTTGGRTCSPPCRPTSRTC